MAPSSRSMVLSKWVRLWVSKASAWACCVSAFDRVCAHRSSLPRSQPAPRTAKPLMGSGNDMAVWRTMEQVYRGEDYASRIKASSSSKEIIPDGSVEAAELVGCRVIDDISWHGNTGYGSWAGCQVDCPCGFNF